MVFAVAALEKALWVLSPKKVAFFTLKPLWPFAVGCIWKKAPWVLRSKKLPFSTLSHCIVSICSGLHLEKALWVLRSKKVAFFTLKPLWPFAVGCIWKKAPWFSGAVKWHE